MNILNECFEDKVKVRLNCEIFHHTRMAPVLFAPLMVHFCQLIFRKATLSSLIYLSEWECRSFHAHLGLKVEYFSDSKPAVMLIPYT